MSESVELLQAERRLGTVLKDKYRLDRVLGVGGMAAVYAATHRNRRTFAIKMLHPDLSVIEELRIRFQREGYVANMVEHPGTVAVLDDDVTEDGVAFIVMELLRGMGIDELARKCGGRVPIPESLALVHQLLDVLSAAHAKGIIHRDIKPANLFLDFDGELKVLDFGIARIRDATVSHLATGIGTTLGTPAFMAPEQALGEVNDIDATTDLWAAGATLFTLISGALVHDGTTAQQLLMQAATRPARSLDAVFPDAPRSLIELVGHAVAFDKTARFPSASEMQREVERVARELFGGVPGKERLAPLARSADPGGATSLAPTEQSAPPPNPSRGSARASAAPRVASLGGTANPVSVTAKGVRKRSAFPGVAGVALLAVGGIAAGLFRYLQPERSGTDQSSSAAPAHHAPQPNATNSAHGDDPRPKASSDEPSDGRSSSGAGGALTNGSGGRQTGTGGHHVGSHPRGSGGAKPEHGNSTTSAQSTSGEEEHNPLAMPIK